MVPGLFTYMVVEVVVRARVCCVRPRVGVYDCYDFTPTVYRYGHVETVDYKPNHTIPGQAKTP